MIEFLCFEYKYHHVVNKISHINTTSSYQPVKLVYKLSRRTFLFKFQLEFDFVPSF